MTDKHGAWINYVDAIQNCLNETCHETTQLTPVELHLNKAPKRIWKNYLQAHETLNQEIGHEQKISLARERIHRKRARIAKKINDKICTPIKYNIGDEVLVLANNVSSAEDNTMSKFFDLFEGPYRVNKRCGIATYEVKYIENESIRGPFHASHIKPYIRRNKTVLSEPSS